MIDVTERRQNVECGAQSFRCRQIDCAASASTPPPNPECVKFLAPMPARGWRRVSRAPHNRETCHQGRIYGHGCTMQEHALSTATPSRSARCWLPATLLLALAACSPYSDAERDVAAGGRGLAKLNPAPKQAYELVLTLKDAPGPFAIVEGVAQYDVSNYADCGRILPATGTAGRITSQRSEEHTSELQSQSNLVCRLLLE